MIMRPGQQQLLLPANSLFIWFTLLSALLLNMLMNMGLWGRAAWTPDLLVVALVFWSVRLSPAPEAPMLWRQTPAPAQPLQPAAPGRPAVPGASAGTLL